jgi:hypothetical protein
MIAAALASLAFVAAPATTQAASVGVSIHIGDPYRGGSFRFRSEPDVVLIPSSRVYYVDDYDYYDDSGYSDFDGDLYRYGGWWYLVDDGYWYRARSYRGPFIAISFHSVPRYVYSVPTRYRRNWGGSYANYGGNWGWYRDSARRSYSTRRSYQTRDRGYYQTRDRSYSTPTRDRSYQTRDRYQTRDQNVRYRDNVSNQSRDRSYDGNRTSGPRDQQRDQQVRDQQGRENRARGHDDNSNRGHGNGNGRDKGNRGGHGHGRGGD